MARLLRLHFASIGHGHARLSPLTLDFRHLTSSLEPGSGIDSIVWLRNGGGKSSIINLFYSVLRPNRNEFLGSSAEGKARRIEDYVKRQDLSFVVSEWDVNPAHGPDALARRPTTIRLVGQVLAWKNQQLTDLNRVYFSIRAIPGVLELESLPILGLADSHCERFDEFRQWLRDTSHRHPETEISDTINQRKWRDNLESLGIDTELFRYQLQMNQREGAADELFRFGSAQDFIDFFLDLTLEREGAEQLAKNIEAQRDTLRKRPEYLLELEFITSIRVTLVSLVGAIELERDCRAKLEHALRRTAALIIGLDARAEQLDRRQKQVEDALGEAKAQVLRVRNERDKLSRWSRGLERRALELDLVDAKQALASTEANKQAIETQLRVTKAAQALREVHASEEAVAHWTRELHRSELELAPQRESVETEGTLLRAALARLRASREADAEACKRERGTRREQAKLAQEQVDHHTHELGRLQQELAGLDGQIRRYTQAREHLLKRGVLQPHEAAANAGERWQERCDALEQRGLELEEERQGIAERLGELNDRVQDLRTRKATRSTELRTLDNSLRQAIEQRDNLRANPRIVEVEETEEPNLETPELGRRLRQRAEFEHHQLLRSQVDGAEDRRAITAIDNDGLWPPKRDVELTIHALQDADIAAHSGLGYLAENVHADQWLDYIRSAPETFAGVVIIGDQMERVRERLPRLPRLHTTVRITRIQSLEFGTPADADDHVVVTPDPATYDRRAAAERKLELERDVGERARREAGHTADERAFIAVAEQLDRFLAAHGKGRLERLEQSVTAAQAELEHIDAELETHGHTREELEMRDSELRTERGRVDSSRLESQRHLHAVESFIESHERHISDVRDRREAALREQTDHERKREAESQRINSFNELADISRDREDEARAAARDHAREHDGVHHYRDEPAPEVLPDIESLRTRYEANLISYESALGVSLARYQLDENSKRLAKHKRQYEPLAKGLAAETIEATLRTSLNLERERSQAEDDLQQANMMIGEATSHRAAIERNLAETTKRREAPDLPPDVEIADARAARELSRRYDDEAEQQSEALRNHETAIQQHQSSLDTLTVELSEGKNAARELRTMVETIGLDLPVVEAVTPPLESGALRRDTDERKREFTTTHKRHGKARDDTRELMAMLRKHSGNSMFAQLDRRYKDRLAANDEELRESAEKLQKELDDRKTVLEHQLEQYDRDRKLLVQHLLRLTDEAERVLKRAQRASTLPEGLDAWSNRPYLRLRYTLPESEPDREARLGPVVDQILNSGALPSGPELVRRAIHELARPGGFDVSILKPDTILRPDPLPIAAMASFSRGQQLTAAILLYCTLVQLRAQNRGQGQDHRRKDGGLLLLDNPLGTCSTVALVKLQRRIAGQMNVQLIYTTGIEDREAISVMPNTIRLRNTHRDTRTGDHHITQDDGESVVEQARIVNTAAP
ncbi:hypothetical protein ACNOYE_08825 [Nannocystaceae bacterium ST9]